MCKSLLDPDEKLRDVAKSYKFNSLSLGRGRAMRERDKEISCQLSEENRVIYCVTVHFLPTKSVLAELNDQLQLVLVEMEKAKRLLEQYGDSSSREHVRRVNIKVDMLNYRIKNVKAGTRV